MPGERGIEGWVPAYLILKEQNCWFIICHTISSEAMIEVMCAVE